MRSIELFGVPGAGKTTVARALPTPILEGWKLTPNTSAPRFTMQHVPLAAGALRRAVGRAVSADACRVALLCARQHAAVRCGATLFHDGAVNGAWRMLFHDARLDRKALSRLLPASDLVVVLDLPLEVAKERIRLKQTPGPINRTLANAPLPGPVWQRAADARDLVVDVIGDRAVRVDATAGVDEVAKLVAKALH